MATVTMSQSLFKRLKNRKPRIRVTVEVTPINGASVQEVSNLVRDLLAESAAGDVTDTFREVELVSAVESSAL